MVTDRQNFVVELSKRQPLGFLLVVLGTISFAFVAACFEAKLDVGPFLKVGVIVMFLAWVVGMPLLLRDASRLQAERRARAADQTPSPWQK